MNFWAQQTRRAVLLTLSTYLPRQFLSNSTYQKPSRVRFLAELAEDLDLEEHKEQETFVEEDSGDNQCLHSWEDFQEGLTDEKVRVLDEGVQPVRSMLVKVC